MISKESDYRPEALRFAATGNSTNFLAPGNNESEPWAVMSCTIFKIA
jgi:hypothetical protein